MALKYVCNTSYHINNAKLKATPYLQHIISFQLRKHGNNISGHGKGEDIPSDIAGMNVFWTNGSMADLGFTPFSLTRDLSILYVDEEGFMSDGDKHRLEERC